VKVNKNGRIRLRSTPLSKKFIKNTSITVEILQKCKYQHPKTSPRYASNTRKIQTKNVETKVSHHKNDNSKYTELRNSRQRKLRYSKNKSEYSELIILAIKHNASKISRHRLNRWSNNKSKNNKLSNFKSKYTRNKNFQLRNELNHGNYKFRSKINEYNYHKLQIILSNDVEENPGPRSAIDTLLEIKNIENHIVLSYNIQGGKDYKKLKRIMNFFLKQKISRKAVINLQETHFHKNDTLEYHWKHGCVQSLTKNNSGGVAILFNKAYYDEILETRNDNEGRFCSFTASKNDRIFSYINLYAPNDHYKSMKFFEETEILINKIKQKYPTTEIIVSGDFNFVFDNNVDAIGRQNKKTRNRTRKASHKNND
jgi:hypothetical protein